MVEGSAMRLLLIETSAYPVVPLCPVMEKLNWSLAESNAKSAMVELESIEKTVCDWLSLGVVIRTGMALKMKLDVKLPQ